MDSDIADLKKDTARIEDRLEIMFRHVQRLETTLSELEEFSEKTNERTSNTELQIVIHERDRLAADKAKLEAASTHWSRYLVSVIVALVMTMGMFFLGRILK